MLELEKNRTYFAAQLNMGERRKQGQFVKVKNGMRKGIEVLLKSLKIPSEYHP